MLVGLNSVNTKFGRVIPFSLQGSCVRIEPERAWPPADYIHYLDINSAIGMAKLDGIHAIAMAKAKVSKILDATYRSIPQGKYETAAADSVNFSNDGIFSATKLDQRIANTAARRDALINPSKVGKPNLDYLLGMNLKPTITDVPTPKRGWLSELKQALGADVIRTSRAAVLQRREDNFKRTGDRKYIVRPNGKRKVITSEKGQAILAKLGLA